MRDTRAVCLGEGKKIYKSAKGWNIERDEKEEEARGKTERFSREK